jgi:pyruvate/2-oxoglutarate dehydrogenase complex dihydrolipoamide acyltransferase (E2) component
MRYQVRKGEPVIVMNSMKMEHAVTAQHSGVVWKLTVDPEDTIYENEPILLILKQEVAGDAEMSAVVVDLDVIRADVAEVRIHTFKEYESTHSACFAAQRFSYCPRSLTR